MKQDFWSAVKKIVRDADIILEVLDARMPELTRNAEIEEYARQHNKQLIFLINKSDIVSSSAIAAIKKEFHGLHYVFTSSKTSGWIDYVLGITKSKSKKDKPKAAFIGYPNTGKSSLINKLSKGGNIGTSFESGFTKGVSLIAGKGGLMLFDTPGIVPFEGKDEVLLGLISGLSPSKLKDPDVVAFELIKIFMKTNPLALEKAYGVDIKQSPDDLLIEFGKKRNILIKGGIVDERRAAIQLLTDWHKGKIKL
ncbi:MAG: GTPase [Nanoarchaeota archaeon]